jgi:hypothetical protein
MVVAVDKSSEDTSPTAMIGSAPGGHRSTVGPEPDEHWMRRCDRGVRLLN